MLFATVRSGPASRLACRAPNGTYTHTNDVTGTNVDRSAVQWLKLITDTNGSFLALTNGRIYDPAATNPYNYYFPSLMVNKVGDAVFGFSGSRSNSFIGAFYCYRAAGGSTPAQPLILHLGQGPFDLPRWGDYSATAIDPLDNLSFWTVQAYSDDYAGNLWGTWIANIVPSVPE